MYLHERLSRTREKARSRCRGTRFPRLGVTRLEDRTTPSIMADFNGDGRGDLAVGIPFDTIAQGGLHQGSVDVLYGSPKIGLDASNHSVQHWNENTLGGTARAFNNFGSALTAGDFNGDGNDDLAVGVPYDDVAGLDAGAVNVIIGSKDGLTAVDNQVWHQASSLLDSAGGTGDHFGWSLATGDFSGDGNDDLAIGVPGKGIDGHSDAGVVDVLYGTDFGLDTAGNQMWMGIFDTGDGYGSALGKRH